MWTHFRFFLLSLIIFASTPGGPIASTPPPFASEGQTPIKLDVPYEPSSMEVVEIMLEMAGVHAGDWVYDLGCGDGRIVIAAAQKTGAHGVGIDLDPQRIRESLENARRAGVIDRVQFFQQDLFQTDLRKATVVMLYLYPEVNLRLRPKLLRELQPGTRVVSHSHDMGDWKPDQTRIAPNGHKIHFWAIPANVSGIWEWSMPSHGERLWMHLHQRFQNISGTLRIHSEEIPLKDLQLKGDRIEFTVEGVSSGKGRIWRFRGRVRGHDLQGTIAERSIGPYAEYSWRASRIPSSMKAIDE